MLSIFSCVCWQLLLFWSLMYFQLGSCVPWTCPFDDFCCFKNVFVSITTGVSLLILCCLPWTPIYLRSPGCMPSHWAALTETPGWNPHALLSKSLPPVPCSREVDALPFLSWKSLSVLSFQPGCFPVIPPLRWVHSCNSVDDLTFSCC